MIFAFLVLFCTISFAAESEPYPDFAREAVSFSLIVSPALEGDAEIIDLAKWDTGDFVYNDNKEIVASWIPVAKNCESEIKNNKSLHIRERHTHIEVLVREEKQPIDGRYLVRLADVKGKDGSLSLEIELNKKGGELLKTLTKRVISEKENDSKPRFMAVISNNTLYSAPSVLSEIGADCLVQFSKILNEEQNAKNEKTLEQLVKSAKELPVWKFAKKDDEWKSIFDGKTLEGWSIPDVGGEGEVAVEDGCIQLPMGGTLTGVRYEKPFPKYDYEIEYEARRTMGNDFFAALTFPVARSNLSFINGGWGGGVVGVSSIDGFDAANNETAVYMSFKDDKWYKFRVKVTEGKVECTVIDESIETDTEENKRERKVVDLVTYNRRIGLRSESDTLKPFGFGSWCTSGEVRKIKYRMLQKEESEELNSEARKYADQFVR